MRMSPAGMSICASSAASGSTATVAAEVWMRPPDSVSGTRWTRCTPDSYFRRAKTPSPSIRATASLTPPSSVSVSSSIWKFQPCDSACRRYMDSRSPANSAASSPPVPGRISRMAGRASAASLGSSATRSSCSSAGSSASSRAISSSAKARISGSASMARASSRPARPARQAAIFSVTGFSSAYSRLMRAICSGAAPAFSCASRNSKRWRIWIRRSSGSMIQHLASARGAHKRAQRRFQPHSAINSTATWAPAIAVAPVVS